MAGPVGSVTRPPGQYTHCVDRRNYVENPEKWGFFDAGIPSRLEFALCEYLLGGKLVCLAGGGDECAIGTVIGIEEVGYEKSGFDAIDNDFSFNLMLAPYAVDDFSAYRPAPGSPATSPPAYEPHRLRDDVAKHSPLGLLLVDPTPSPRPLPTPSEPAGTSPVDGYGVGYRWQDERGKLVYEHGFQNNLHKIWEGNPQDGSVIALPCLHCECEGSRIFFVCQAMKPFLDIMRGKAPGSPLPSPGEVCHAALDWVPLGLGKALCSLIEDIIAVPIALALAPAALAAFAGAWEAAQAYDDLFVTGPVSKRVELDDTVIVLGRWVWDAGHAGHTELHPVKAFQRVELPPGHRGGNNPKLGLRGDIKAEIHEFHDRWCRLLREAPPPFDPRHPNGIGEAILASLTPEQQAVHLHQEQPENSWTIHPAIDGCAPEVEPPPLH
jgi:hypothetical protein